MNTNSQKFSFHQLIVILLMMTLVSVGFPARGRSKGSDRGNKGQPEQKAPAVSQRSESTPRAEARPSPASSTRSEPRQSKSQASSRPQRQTTPASAPRQAASTQDNSRSARQPAQSTRSASSTPQARSTRSNDRQTVQQATSQPTQQRKTTTPARRVNRTVEVVSTANNNNNNRSGRVSVSSARLESKAPVVSRTVTTSRASSSAEPKSTRQRVVNTVRPEQTRTVERQTETANVVREVEPRSVQPAEIKKRSESAVASKSGTSFDFYGTAHDRTKTKQTSSRTVQARTGSRDVRKKASEPLRVTVSDIQASPKRVDVQEIRNRPSQRDVDRKKSVRVHSDAVRDRNLRQTSSVTLDNTSLRTGLNQRPAAGRNITGRHESPRRAAPSSRIIINNDNRVIVQGAVTRQHPRPYISRHLFRDVSHLRRDRHWVNYGSSFYFGWSSSSYGVAVCLPYYRTSIHYGTPYYGMSYYYPRYHRKYVFVSIGGYWPYDYRYQRYYWYGCHPYYWYGSRVIYEPAPVTYNTYNYYNTDNNTADTYGYGFSSSDQPYYTLGNPKEDPVDEPQFETPADLCFDHAVTLFAAGKYDEAVEQFRQAVLLSPDDVIVPFTYSRHCLPPVTMHVLPVFCGRPLTISPKKN